MLKELSTLNEVGSFWDWDVAELGNHPDTANPEEFANMVDHVGKYVTPELLKASKLPKKAEDRALIVHKIFRNAHNIVSELGVKKAFTAFDSILYLIWESSDKMDRMVAIREALRLADPESGSQSCLHIADQIWLGVKGFMGVSFNINHDDPEYITFRSLVDIAGQAAQDTIVNKAVYHAFIEGKVSSERLAMESNNIARITERTYEVARNALKGKITEWNTR